MSEIIVERRDKEAALAALGANVHSAKYEPYLGGAMSSLALEYGGIGESFQIEVHPVARAIARARAEGGSPSIAVACTDNVHAELERIRSEIKAHAALVNQHTNATGGGPIATPVSPEDLARIKALDARKAAAQDEVRRLLSETGAILEKKQRGPVKVFVRGARGFPADLLDGSDMAFLRKQAAQYSGDVLDEWGMMLGVKRRSGEPCDVYREALLLATEQEWATRG